MIARIGRQNRIQHHFKPFDRSFKSKLIEKNGKNSLETCGGAFSLRFGCVGRHFDGIILAPSFSARYFGQYGGISSDYVEKTEQNSARFSNFMGFQGNSRGFSTESDKNDIKKTELNVKTDENNAESVVESKNKVEESLKKEEEQKTEYERLEEQPYYERNDFHLNVFDPPPNKNDLKWRNINEDLIMMFSTVPGKIAAHIFFLLLILMILLDIGFIIIQYTQFSEEWLNEKIGEFINEQTGLIITYDTPDFLKAFKEGKLDLTNVRIVRPNPVPPSENWCVFDLTISKVNMKTSVLWWLRGRGYVKEIQLSGVRGVVDRRTEWYDPHWRPRNWDVYWGDFWFKNVSVRDCNFTLYFPDPTQRSVKVYLYRLDAKRIRRRYLLYDLVCSQRFDAVFDGCPISYRKVKNQKQIPYLGTEMMLQVGGLSVDLLSRNAEGPLGWLAKGEIDFNFQVFVPPEHLNLDNISMNVYTRIRNMKLDPPLSTDLSNAVAIPVARYFNRYKKSVKISSHINFPMKHFDRSWSLADAEFWDKMSGAIVESLTTMYETNKPTTWSEWWEYFWKTVKA